jgi:hypothetical protein
MGMSRLADLCSWPGCGSRGLMMLAIATKLLGAVTSIATARNAAAPAMLLRALA